MSFFSAFNVYQRVVGTSYSVTRVVVLILIMSSVTLVTSTMQALSLLICTIILVLSCVLLTLGSNNDHVLLITL